MPVVDDFDSPPTEAPARKRLRTSHACDICRSRKIRCNGQTPCASCAQAESECTYGSEANSRGKSDLILEGVRRVEKYLQELHANIASSALPSPALISPGFNSSASDGRASFSYSPRTEVYPVTISGYAAAPTPAPAHVPAGVRRHLTPQSNSHSHSSPHSDHPSHASFPSHHSQAHVHDHHHDHYAQNSLGITNIASEPTPTPTTSFENAVLESLHTSTTESILQWPHFDVFPSLRHSYTSIFHLERSRPSLRSPSIPRIPYISSSEVDTILSSFESTFNFWYPTVSRAQLARTRSIIANGHNLNDHGKEEDEAETCLAHLTMALGCAGQCISGLMSGTAISPVEMDRRKGKRALADMYFDNVRSKLAVAHCEVSATATHCLFFVALYFAFLRRPLQACTYIHAAASKSLLLLLSYPAPTSSSAEESERVRRIFWSCYILESDHLAELSHLPISNISRRESAIPLPSARYRTHSRTPHLEELSNLYFLACISMRRLLNRVHQLLYAQGSGAATDPARFPRVVRELMWQLEEWRDVLPGAFRFTVNTDDRDPDDSDRETETETEYGGFLRQRYLACRSVIYRPYLMWMLARGEEGMEVLGREGLVECGKCLEACLMHVLNLRGFGHTLGVDMWICSLSMAGAMLVLLAACRVPALRNLIGPEVLLAGTHLKQMLEGWQRVAGGPNSPSVDQSIRVIDEADRFIREVYGADEAFPTLRRMSGVR